MCKLKTCLYDHQCKDCLHFEPDKTGKKYQKTGIPTTDMKAYKREYRRRRRERELRLEMEHAGVAG